MMPEDSKIVPALEHFIAWALPVFILQFLQWDSEGLCEQSGHSLPNEIAWSEVKSELFWQSLRQKMRVATLKHEIA